MRRSIIAIGKYQLECLVFSFPNFFLRKFFFKKLMYFIIFITILTQQICQSYLLIQLSQTRRHFLIILSTWLQDLISLKIIQHNWQLTLWLRSQAGEFIFAAVCDRICNVYLGGSKSSPHDDFKIIEITTKSAGQFQSNAGAQPEIFQGKGGLVGLGHFCKHFVKNTRKKATQGKIWEFFLLDTLKTTF